MQVLRLADVHVPTTLVAEQAAEAAAAWCSKALMERDRRVVPVGGGARRRHGHRVRRGAAVRRGDAPRPRALVTAFDNATVSFDEAGGNVGLDVRRGGGLAAGAAGPAVRGHRPAHVGERGPGVRRQSHLLEVGTAIDISGTDRDLLGARPRAESSRSTRLRHRPPVPPPASRSRRGSRARQLSHCRSRARRSQDRGQPARPARTAS